jgi:hypothetical protein
MADFLAVLQFSVLAMNGHRHPSGDGSTSWIFLEPALSDEAVTGFLEWDIQWQTRG